MNIDTRLLKSLPEYVRFQFNDPYPLPSNIQNEAYYEGNPIPSNDWALAEAIIWLIGDTVKTVICAFVGHDFEDHTTPHQMENGGYTMVCTRCGWGDKGYF